MKLVRCFTAQRLFFELARKSFVRQRAKQILFLRFESLLQDIEALLVLFSLYCLFFVTFYLLGQNSLVLLDKHGRLGIVAT